MRTLQRSLLATTIALSLLGSGAATAQFNNVYFFGDSLTKLGVSPQVFERTAGKKAYNLAVMGG